MVTLSHWHDAHAARAPRGLLFRPPPPRAWDTSRAGPTSSQVRSGLACQFLTFETRHVIEGNATYDEALQSITTYKPLGPAYIIIAGRTPPLPSRPFATPFVACGIRLVGCRHRESAGRGRRA